MTDRREVAAALFALLSGVSWGDELRSFVYTSQRLQTREDCPGQPALYLCQGDEKQSRATGMYPIRDLEFWALVYQDKGRDTSHPRPADENDLILAAFEAALSSDSPDERCTLGGLAHHARIEGTILKDTGDLDGQAALAIPIWVMIP